ncbi:hypothetical protein QYF61_019801 [Mycteria americana]|uniref:Uncharacterized protein n=1 Tax=Mycteria americana TaxID=33587 RepID=A0AAN7MPU6_MYCAM|nr:hypothetical protein QYF61_019801 [Mycteria americana]
MAFSQMKEAGIDGCTQSMEGGSTSSEAKHLSQRHTQDTDTAGYTDCHRQGAAFNSPNYSRNHLVETINNCTFLLFSSGNHFVGETKNGTCPFFSSQVNQVVGNATQGCALWQLSHGWQVKKKQWKQKSTWLVREEAAPPKREQEGESEEAACSAAEQPQEQEREETEIINESETTQSLSLSELQDMRKDYSHHPGEQAITLLLQCWDTGTNSQELEVESVLPKTGWRLNHFPGQPVPMLDNPFSEEKFPNIQSKPPLGQLEAISSCPIACYLGEETDPHLSTTSFQAKQSQLPQPLLIRLLLQTLHQLRCPSLDTLQHLNVPLVVGGPKPNTVFEVRPHQCRVQGHDHFPSPAGHAIFDTSQDAIGFLGRLGTLLAHIQPAVNQHPQVLFCLAAFQPLFPKPVALHGVAVAQVQALALGLVKPHTIGLGPSIQPVQPSWIPLPFRAASQGTLSTRLLNRPKSALRKSKYPQVLLLSAALNPFIPQSVLILGIAPMQVQDLALGFVELQEVPMGPLLKPVQVPLDGIPSLKRITCTTQLGVICKLAEGALSPTVYVVDEDIK